MTASYKALLRCVCAAIAAALCLSPLQAEDTPFLAISDIHFNVFNGLDREAFRQLVDLDVAEWPAFLAKLGQPVVKQGNDSNYTLLVSALAAAAKASPDPAFILFPGDFMGHEWQTKYNSLALRTIGDDPEAFREFTAKALQLIANEFQRHFPDSAILPTLGNDDSFCSDYWIQPGGEFLTAFAGIWQPLMRGTVERTEFFGTFSQYGCYAADLPTFPNHRLISLNTVFWSASYCEAAYRPVANETDCCGCVDSGDTPGNAQFAWLEQQLAASAADGKGVWLLMHIPPGLDSFAEEKAHGRGVADNFWKDAFMTRYLKLLARYRDTIQLSFAGHTHMDDYRIDSLEGVPVLFHKIVPAVSPIYGNNPSFLVCQADSETGDLTNWQTHFLSLKLAGSETPSENWSEEYDARQTYGPTRFNAGTVARLFEGIRENPGSSQAKSYSLFYEVSAQEIPQTALPIFTCAILEPTFADFRACVSDQGLPAPVRSKSPVELRRRANGLSSRDSK